MHIPPSAGTSRTSCAISSSPWRSRWAGWWPSPPPTEAGRSGLAVAGDEALVDRDAQSRPVRDFDLAVFHRKILDRKLVQHRVGTERILQNEATGGHGGDVQASGEGQGTT